MPQTSSHHFIFTWIKFWLKCSLLRWPKLSLQSTVTLWLKLVQKWIICKPFNTPNHFILGRANPNLPPNKFVDKEISSRKRWCQAQVITTLIWNRWWREYLPSPITCKKWTKDTTNLKVWDLVLVVDCSTPKDRSLFMLGGYLFFLITRGGSGEATHFIEPFSQRRQDDINEAQ